eukprot:jgi/Hompol1/1732/HPOL_005701-RA
MTPVSPVSPVPPVPDAPDAHLLLPAPFKDALEYADALCSFLRSHSWLLNTHAVDFFLPSVDFWSTALPLEWRSLKDDSVCSTTDLLRLASHFTTSDHWPQSLKDFVAHARSIALPRDPTDPWLLQTLSQGRDLDPRIVYGMSPKKRIEVQSLACVIHSLATQHNTNSIIDMGAGQGYLDASLAYMYGHTVIGVDDDMVQTCGAKFNSEKIERRVGGRGARRQPGHDLDANENAGNDQDHETQQSIGKLFHVNRRVERWESFSSVLEGLKGAGDENDDEIERLVQMGRQQGWLLCGLHACGE